MVILKHIETFEVPELQPYRTMRRQQEHRDRGIFVAEGEKVVRRLLQSRFTVISVLLPEHWYSDLKQILENRPETIDVFVAEKKLLETLTGFSMYQGLLALGTVPAMAKSEDLLANGDEPVLLAATEGLSSAENLGTLVRNCAAFSGHGLITGETCVSPFLRRAVRSSMGAVFELPILESRNLVDELQQLRVRGVRLVAAHPHTTALTLPRAHLAGPCCIVFGSEGYGLSPAVLAVCDEAAAIPMAPTVDSLNVGSAAAAFFYEACRQRGRM
jgi:tRNA G18 (ribose-2'-O)-methylase SpoU